MEKQLNFIEVDDRVNLAYQFIDKQNSTKPLLIFLHEGLGSIAQWKGFPELLCNTLNLDGLVYERYGYGYSTPFFEDRKPDYLFVEAEYFLPKLLQKLALEKRDLILIGHSDGASIALIFAANSDNKVVAVVSMAAHVFVDELSIGGIIEAHKIYEANDDLRNRLKKYHFDHVDSTFYAWSKMWQTEEFKQFNIEHLLPKINAPIIAIQGLQDEYGLPSQVESIVKKGAHPNNKKLFLENCKHSPHLQATAQVIKSISAFLKDNL
jgi:pimeloyl-ACP methyl ester carboxylesterase